MLKKSGSALWAGVFSAQLLLSPLASVQADPPPLVGTGATPVKGGFTNTGLTGEYFANPNLSGTAAFKRRELRISFDWGTVGKPGGSTAPRFRDVGSDNFSARWDGQVIPCFSELYTFKLSSAGGVRLFVRAEGSPTWLPLIDHWGIHALADDTGSLQVTSGARYDVRLEYRKTTGQGAVKLTWSSASLPEQLIDPLRDVGMNVTDLSAAYADMMKGSRNQWNWEGPSDAQGWPMADKEFCYQESLNTGLSIDPLMRGKITFSFKGKADPNLYGNGADLVYSYNAQTNTTSGSFMGRALGSNASFFRVMNSHRDGTPTGPAGVTDVKMMRPIAPDSMTSYAPDEIFTTHFREAMSHFTCLRFQLLANMERSWSERTLPTFFNQSGGQTAQNKYLAPDNSPISQNWYTHEPIPTDNGPSLEYKILLANETGCDLMLSLPVPASDDYMKKMAQTLKYGSDGVNPYTSPQANPTYPPLNPNLRVYTEIGNELWNFGSIFYVDWQGINAQVALHADAKDADYQAFNYDAMPTTVSFEGDGAAPGSTVRYTGKDLAGNSVSGTSVADGSGHYHFRNIARSNEAGYAVSDGTTALVPNRGSYDSLGEWRNRFIALRTMQHSNTFREVFGDDGMQTRIRPLYEGFYSFGSTYSTPLGFLANYFGNADGKQHVADPHPVNYFLYGTGGGTYYGASNGNGLNGIMPDPTFNATAVPVGTNVAPANPVWKFSAPNDGTSAAGIVRLANPTSPPAGMPAAYMGSAIISGEDAPWNAGIAYGPQYAYITDRAKVTGRFTIPSNQTSKVYAISFKAVNKVDSNQNLRVILDAGTANERDITTKTFNQDDGITAPAYDGSKPWRAFLVSWVWNWSDYYASQTFEAEPGSVHTVTIQGKGKNFLPAASQQTAYIGEVRLTSTDAIYAGGMPGGGEANGQPAGTNYQALLNAEADWARAYGLKSTGYEGGWSSGGDDGGSPLQNAAKYSDPRTADAQQRALDMFAKAGGDFTVLGTYAQYPSWTDAIAQQGLLDVSNYAIVQGINNAQNALPAAPTNGQSVPSTLTPFTATLSVDTFGSQITKEGGWFTWNILVPKTGVYTLSLDLGGAGGSAVMSVDEVVLASKSPLAAQDTLVGTTRLTAGQHTVKVRSTSSVRLSIFGLSATMPDGPPAPYLNEIDQNNGALHLSWQGVAGASGYSVHMLSDGQVQNMDAGNGTTGSISGLVGGKSYTFWVTAYNALGESLASNKRELVYLAVGQLGLLAEWDFVNYETVDDSAAKATAYSPLVTPGMVRRGAGLTSYILPSVSAHRFTAGPPDGQYATDLAGAVAKNQYIEFSIAPKNNLPVTARQLFIFPYTMGTGTGVVVHSADGVHFNLDNPDAVVRFASITYAQRATTIDLSSRPELQNATMPLVWRIYFHGVDYYNAVGIDKVNVSGYAGQGNPNNMAPSVAMTGPAGGQSYAAPATIAMSASATDVDGWIQKVEFYNGNTLIGTDTAVPFTFTWSNVPVGVYTLTAKATDNSGALSTSAAIPVTVYPAGSVPPPTVSIVSPSSNAEVKDVTAVTAVVTSGLALVKLELYVDGNRVSTLMNPPWSFNWNTLQDLDGAHVLQVKAWDVSGNHGVSGFVPVTVSNAGLAQQRQPKKKYPSVIKLSNGTTDTAAFAAPGCRSHVFSRRGELIRELSETSFNGRDADGQPLPAGNYFVEVSCADGSKNRYTAVVLK